MTRSTSVSELEYMWGNADYDWLPGQKGPANSWNTASSQELGPDLRIQKLYQPLRHTGQSQALTAWKFPKQIQEFTWVYLFFFFKPFKNFPISEVWLFQQEESQLISQPVKYLGRMHQK